MDIYNKYEKIMILFRVHKHVRYLSIFILNDMSRN